MRVSLVRAEIAKLEAEKTKFAEMKIPDKAVIIEALNEVSLVDCYVKIASYNLDYERAIVEAKKQHTRVLELISQVEESVSGRHTVQCLLAEANQRLSWATNIAKSCTHKYPQVIDISYPV
jgi:hypothetical protein